MLDKLSNPIRSLFLPNNDDEHPKCQYIKSMDLEELPTHFDFESNLKIFTKTHDDYSLLDD